MSETRSCIVYGSNSWYRREGCVLMAVCVSFTLTIEYLLTFTAWPHKPSRSIERELVHFSNEDDIDYETNDCVCVSKTCGERLTSKKLFFFFLKKVAPMSLKYFWLKMPIDSSVPSIAVVATSHSHNFPMFSFGQYWCRFYNLQWCFHKNNLLLASLRDFSSSYLQSKERV